MSESTDQPMSGDPWARTQTIALLISLLGSVWTKRRDSQAPTRPSFMFGKRRAADLPEIQAEVDRPGFFAALAARRRRDRRPPTVGWQETDGLIGDWLDRLPCRLGALTT